MVAAVTAMTAVAARVRAGGGERPCSQSALETNSEGTQPALRSQAMARGSICTLEGTEPALRRSLSEGILPRSAEGDSRRGFSRAPLREPSRGSR